METSYTQLISQIHFQETEVLKITVIRGYEINRKSVLNLVDKPNPQIKLKFPSAKGPNRFVTSSKIDTVNPVWNEEFAFILPSGLKPREVKDDDEEEEEDRTNQLKVVIRLRLLFRIRSHFNPTF